MKMFIGYLLDDEAQGLLEYGLILVLVSIVSVGVLTTMGTNIDGLLRTVIPLPGGS